MVFEGHAKAIKDKDEDHDPARENTRTGTDDELDDAKGKQNDVPPPMAAAVMHQNDAHDAKDGEESEFVRVVGERANLIHPPIRFGNEGRDP